jgi:predicted Fe-S protein YdhL (DUF1289 family)
MNWSISIPAPAAPAILTPCIGICELAADGCCEGCHRTGTEIARWASMEDSERRWLMDEVLPARELRRGAGGAR